MLGPEAISGPENSVFSKNKANSASEKEDKSVECGSKHLQGR